MANQALLDKAAVESMFAATATATEVRMGAVQLRCGIDDCGIQQQPMKPYRLYSGGRGRRT